MDVAKVRIIRGENQKQSYLCIVVRQKNCTAIVKESISELLIEEEATKVMN
jgi:hypothetical protein